MKHGSLRFTCPGNGLGSDKIAQSLPSGKFPFFQLWLEKPKHTFLNITGNDDLIIWVQERNVEAHKVVKDEAVLLPCSNKLLRLPPNIDSADVAGGVMTYNHVNVVVTCGKTESLEDQTCFVMNNDINDYQETPLLLSRDGAASLVIDNDNTVWVTGGGSDPSAPTEFIRFYDNDNNTTTKLASSIGPFLPSPLKYHCLERLGPDVVLLIGGQDLNGGGPIQFFWSSNIPNPTTTFLQWSQSQMNVPRSQHACGVLEDLTLSNAKIVVAAGGVTGSFGNTHATPTHTVALLTLENFSESFSVDATWKSGPDLPDGVAIVRAQSVTTGDQKSIFIIGGTTPGQQQSQAVYRLQCSNLQCSWQTIDHALTMSIGLQASSGQGLALMCH